MKRKLFTFWVTMLLTLAANAAEIKPSKVMGNALTSVAALDGKYFAITYENGGNTYAFCFTENHNLNYEPINTALTSKSYMFIIEAVEGTNYYYLRSRRPDGSVYEYYGGGGYLNSQDAGGSVCFTLGLTDKNGQDIENGAVWDIQYVDGQGFTIKNIGTGKYKGADGAPAKYDDPTYFTINEFVDSYIPALEALLAEGEEMKTRVNDDAAKATYDAAIAGINTASITGNGLDECKTVDAALNILVKAQVAAGSDFTRAIINPSFETGNTNGWISNSGGGAANNGNFHAATGNWFVERWQWSGSGGLSDGSLLQAITGLPNGQYKLTAEMQNREQQNSDAAGHGFFLAANDEKTEAVTSDGATFEVVSLVENGSLTIGTKLEGCTGNWVCVDNFLLTLVTPAISAVAIALPASGDMDAGTWYYIDIPVTGSDYKATATTLENIVYTGNGSILLPDAVNVTTKFTATNNELEAKRYYVKSSTVNNLEIAAASYSYSVGAATANVASGSLIKPGQTINVTFQLNTNDPDPTVSTNFSNVTFDGQALSVTSTANGFSFTVPTNLTLDKDYELSIPANAIGYTGKAMNTAATFTYHTPYFWDGTYYMRNTDTNYQTQYLARGGNWGTQAITNEEGRAVNLTLNDGKYTIELVDFPGNFIGDDGFCYSDCTNERVRSYTVTRVTGGYKFLNTNNNKYLAIYVTDKMPRVVGDAVEGGNLNGATNVWAIETAIDRATNKYNTLRTAVQALYNVSDFEELTSGAHNTLGTALNDAATSVANATTANDIEAATSTLKTAAVTYAGTANPTNNAKFDLTFLLTNPDLTHLPSWSSGWNGWDTEQTGGNSQVMRNGYATSEDGTKTAFFEYWNNPPVANNQFALYLKANLPAGTYNMSCYAFAQYEQEGKHENVPNGVYFYANDVQGSAVNNARLSEQSIEFVNTKEQEVKIGLKPVTGNGNTWMGIGYVELYKVPAAPAVVLNESAAYNEVETAADVELTKTIYKDWNTVILPFSMTSEEITAVFGEGTLYAFTDADAGQLNFTEATTLSAHTPYLFKANAAKNISSETISGRTITVSTNNLKTSGTDYNFVGTYVPYAKGEAANPITENDYILGETAFKKAAATTGKNALKAFRCYIQANEATSTAKSLNICIDGETTAISTIDGEPVNQNEGVYDLSGRAVKNPTKGMYIINGKKYLVK